MHKNSCLCALLILGFCGCNLYAADSPYKPRKGYWRQVLVLVDTKGVQRPIVLSSASYPETCTRALSGSAANVELSDGYVWTDKNYQILTYKEHAGIAEIKQEVIEFKCIYEPWKGGVQPK